MSNTNLGHHVLFDRMFTVVARFPDSDEGTRDANAFMMKNEETAVLEVTCGQVILASCYDKGVQLDHARHIVDGRSYKVTRTFPNTDEGQDAATSMVLRDSDAHVLDVANGAIYMSRANDEGEPVNTAPALRSFLVIGLYGDGDSDRFADSFDAGTPEDAETAAKVANPGLDVAGVVELVDGKMQVVA